MDALCDTLVVEEILARALARRPDLAARYWPRRRRLPTFRPEQEIPPRFLTARHAASELVHGADLAFLPGPSAREEAYLRRVGYDRDCGFAVVHSAGGLLLCSRGRVRPRHLYVATP